jgi:hypothetical protein
MPDTNKLVDAIGGIIVADWKPYEKGALKGFLAVRIGQALRLNDLKLFEKAGKSWIGWPDKEYAKRDGSKGYAPLVEFATREDERAFQDAILTDLDRYLQENRNAG